MPSCFATRADGATIPIEPIAKGDLPRWLSAADPAARRWVEATGFRAEEGATCLVPGAGGALARVLVGAERPGGLWTYAGLPGVLAAGRYRLDVELPASEATRAALGWALATYRFARYKAAKPAEAVLVWPKGADKGEVERLADATCLARDLINTPAEDMGPDALAEAALAVAKSHRAKASLIVGDDLLAKNWPSVHMVGRAAAKAPRLVDIRWGAARHPKVTIVGKGVCFDSGGLDLKGAEGMKLMKKDMGGAAHAIALAQAVMAAGLPVRLRVLLPMVENAVAGNAFRPLDVIRTRKGTTVEVGNTDAEGRLILCDALAEADSEKPALLVDFATLTGAARVALGPDLPALFANDDRLAADLARHGLAVEDPVWRLPLHAGYRRMLESRVADLSSTGSSPYAGSITAALFLEHFVSATTPWAHFDIMAWNGAARPGRPEGGEALSLRAVYAVIKERHGMR